MSKLLSVFIFLILPQILLAANAKKPIVFWLSIDGFKPEYLDKAATPQFKKMLEKAVFSKSLMPIFPSITFPSHCSQATGVKVSQHGIPSNTFYDTSLKKVFSYPGDSALLEAEPIWQTVKRGGLRSAVQNWPLSFNQTGSFKADYFNQSYDNELSDEQRIDQVLRLWEKDRNEGKELDLIMAYIVGPDSAGHKFGPNDPRVFSVVENVDRLIGKIQDKIKSMSESSKNKDLQFYFLITTDHGMLAIDHGVNFQLLANLPENSQIRLIPGGNVGHIFLDQLNQSEKKQTIIELKTQFAKHSFVKAYLKDELPPAWGMNHEHRIGDMVVVLDKGYAFINNASRITTPVKETNGPFGMHGYDPSLVSEMKGLFILWQYPERPAPLELKSVDSLDLHPTVSWLLNVKPSPKATGKIIPEIQTKK